MSDIAGQDRLPNGWILIALHQCPSGQPSLPSDGKWWIRFKRDRFKAHLKRPPQEYFDSPEAALAAAREAIASGVFKKRSRSKR